MFSNPLSQEKARAIISASDLGLLLQEEIPSLTDGFRQGLSAAALVTRHAISTSYDYPKTITERAVLYALGSFAGGFGRNPYGGLLPLGEFRALKRKYAEKRGTRLTTLMREKQCAIYSFDSQDRKTFGGKGGKAAALLRGQIPWTTDEINTAYTLWLSPQYQRTEPPKQGLPDLEKIAQFLNDHNHVGRDVRNKHAVDCQVRKYRKKHNLA